MKSPLWRTTLLVFVRKRILSRMCQQNYLVRGLTGAFTLWLLFLVSLPLFGDAPEEKKGLFYYVVDRSGSITTYGLKEPIQKAITQHAAQLPEDTEVRLVFFSRRASESKRWERMTVEAKQDFADFFADNLVPDGPTRLYDTVAEVMNEIRASSEDYRFVTVLVFSDGENNWTRSYRSWKQLEPVYGDLVKRHDNSFIYWVTLEFDPAESPPAWVQHEPQPPGTKEIPIPEPAPGAEFAGHPLQLKAGEKIQFEYEPTGGRVDTFAWDFGDGTTSAEQDPVHRYEREGTYTVTLQTKGPGGEAEEVKAEFVAVAPVIPLTANFRFSPERTQVGNTIQLQDISGGNPEAREWSLNGEAFSTEIAPSFIVEEVGGMEVSLTVKRGEETDTMRRTVTALPPAPPAGFTIDPAEAAFGETVRFIAQETQPDWVHTWTIDGEITLKGAEVEWTSDRDGLMTVLHAVEGPGGLSRRADRIFIHPAVEFVPATAFSIEPRFFTEGETVVLKARETYDGWVHEWLVDGEHLGNGPEWHWESDRIGNLLITHRIRNAESNVVHEESDEVLGQAPELVQVRFSASPTSGTYPLEVQFQDESVGAPVAYHWDFGDGNSSNERNPKHVYERAGDFVVTLAVTNAQGAVTQNVDSAILSVAAPMPFWQKIALWVAVALVVWVLVIVPLILRPILAPQKGPKLVGLKTYPLYLRARRGWTRFFWPKTSLTIGSGLNSDIRLPSDGAIRGNLALIERAPAASNYSIRPTKKNEIFRIEKQSSLMHPEVETRSKITRARLLKDGDTYEIGGERLTWCQPKPRQVRKKKESQKKKPLVRARQTLVKVRN